MDVGKARKLEFRISIRSLILVIAVVAVLLVPVAWSIRQSHLTQNALAQALAAEKAANRDRGDAEQAKGKLKVLRDEAIQRAARRDPNEEAERSRQLAEEIDSLSRIHERIQEDLYRTKAKTAKPAPPPTLDALRDPRNRVRELPSAPDAGAP
jgi:hypothetical protein